VKSYVIHLDGIGPVKIERSVRARRLQLSVRASTGVRVAVPRGMSFADGERLARSKRDWIKQKLKDLNAAQNRLGPSLETADAEAVIRQRVAYLARRFGFVYRQVKVRPMISRWGSCSSTNVLNFNTQITRLPDALRDFIIIHELVHTVIMNHGLRFWARLDEIYGPGNARKLNRQLKRYHPAPLVTPGWKSENPSAEAGSE